MESKKPVLITLTAPSAAGKSYLFNYIRDVAKLPCLISTTTRSPRSGERDGIDYHFISEEESLRLEKEDQFAELANYNGTRYGVTKTEFHSKLEKGMAFLVCEPSGIDHYVKPALDVGALHFKVFVHVDPEVRLKRFRERAIADMSRKHFDSYAQSNTLNATDMIIKEFNTSLNRLTAMLTEETNWFQMHQWDQVVFGVEKPEVNVEIILNAVEKMRALDVEGQEGRTRTIKYLSDYIEHTQAQMDQWERSRNQME